MAIANCQLSLPLRTKTSASGMMMLRLVYLMMMPSYAHNVAKLYSDLSHARLHKLHHTPLSHAEFPAPVYHPLIALPHLT